MHSAGKTKGIVDNEIMIAIFFAIIIIIVISLIYGGSDDKKQKEEASQETSQPTMVRVGKEKSTYRFDSYWDKIVRVDVKSDAEFYPKGGKVKVTTSTGNSYISTPGTSEVRPQKPDGIFTFERKDSTAWGVEVWQ